MDNEQRYKEALLHVIKFMRGDNEFDSWKPLRAETANQIIEMCISVIGGKTTEEAIKEITLTNN